MRYIKFVLIGSMMVFLGATNAHADVIYTWHSTSPGPYVTATGGELVITNAAYFSGSFDFFVGDSSDDPGPGPDRWVPQYGGSPYPRIINSPVISASLTFNLTGDGWVPGVSTEPGSQYFSDTQLPFGSTLTFNDDGTLTGSLFLFDVSEQVDAGGTHYDWQIYNYGSDYFGSGECGYPACDGGSGYWQLSSVTPVPEPPVWPLFGLGVLGLSTLLVWRRRA
ncbi:MAG TPA: PEP-CTERM sorting domain-containing protein [Rhodanobacteraceae bacterium]|nr:PEP-CTERM sorting domain-containing protein [Rhodanobacteraceae bacterium]